MPRPFAAAMALFCLVSDAQAQELTGTLKKIHDSRTVTLGYRAASIPFSYLDKAGEPIGYSVDLCNAVVADIEQPFEGLELETAIARSPPKTVSGPSPAAPSISNAVRRPPIFSARRGWPSRRSSLSPARSSSSPAGPRSNPIAISLAKLSS
jgi:ABC-type amino acid transport substrate-binding protein